MKPFPKLKSKAVLSPMAGVTDVAFRTLAKQYGAGLTYTEFVHSTALIHGSKKTEMMLQTDPAEKPVAVQLFGHSVPDVVEAAQHVQKNFDIIDVNCGCPAWKVVRSGAGSALLKKPKAIATFISTLVDAVDKPVTVKIRAGIDATTINAIEVAQLAEEAGAAAVAIHGRTQQQGYAGTSDWSIIKEVKEKVNIPVIGNGDVFTPELFKEKLEMSGVDAIMIARGAIGNPAIFTQIKEYLEKGSYEIVHPLEQYKQFLTIAEKYALPFILIKQHAISFTKGLQKGAVLRNKLAGCKDFHSLKELMQVPLSVYNKV